MARATSPHFAPTDFARDFQPPLCRFALVEPERSEAVCFRPALGAWVPALNLGARSWTASDHIEAASLVKSKAASMWSEVERWKGGKVGTGAAAMWSEVGGRGFWGGRKRCASDQRSALGFQRWVERWKLDRFQPHGGRLACVFDWWSEVGGFLVVPWSEVGGFLVVPWSEVGGRDFGLVGSPDDTTRSSAGTEAWEVTFRWSEAVSDKGSVVRSDTSNHQFACVATGKPLVWKRSSWCGSWQECLFKEFLRGLAPSPSHPTTPSTHPAPPATGYTVLAKRGERAGRLRRSASACSSTKRRDSACCSPSLTS